VQQVGSTPAAQSVTSAVCRHVPGAIFEMRKSFSHITPLGTMNWVTTLVNVLEGCLRPENLSNKADHGLFEMYFVFAMIWAFGGALVEKDGINYRKWVTTGCWAFGGVRLFPTNGLPLLLCRAAASATR
jgi:hypothetical protein